MRDLLTMLRALFWVSALSLTLAAHSQTAAGYEVVHDFPEGSQVYAGVVQAGDGKLYGVTRMGGAANTGTVYRMDLSGGFQTIYSFKASDGFPRSSLIEGTDGLLYGVTDGGGAYAAGSVYRISTDGAYAVVYSFGRSGSAPPRTPIGRLLQGPDGSLFGTTLLGGKGTTDYGVVYRISPSGRFSIVKAFSDLETLPASRREGRQPNAGLTLGMDGALYGTTQTGGPKGGGTLFQIRPNGQFQVVHSFEAATDGTYAQGELLPDGESLYGTTFLGGAFGSGTVFRYSPAGF